MDFISFFESPNVGPRNEKISNPNTKVRKKNLINILLKEVLSVFAIRITLITKAR